MVTARVLRGALIALLALLALPHTAQALTWSACPDFSGVRCATVTVPLDRTGADPGQVPLRLGRIGTSMECATVIAFLASDAAAYVVGETVEINGGQLML